MKTTFGVCYDDNLEIIGSRADAREEAKWLRSLDDERATVVKLVGVPDNGFYKVVDTRKFDILEKHIV